MILFVCICDTIDGTYRHIPMNSQTITNACQEQIIPLVNETVRNMGQSHLVLDESTCHTARRTRKWFDDNNIEYFGFAGGPTRIPNGYPPRSPDFNVMEYLFGIVGDRVTSRNPRTTNSMIGTIQDEWNKLTMNTIRNSINHVYKNITYAKDHNGRKNPAC